MEKKYHVVAQNSQYHVIYNENEKEIKSSSSEDSSESEEKEPSLSSEEDSEEEEMRVLDPECCDEACPFNGYSDLVAMIMDVQQDALRFEKTKVTAHHYKYPVTMWSYNKKNSSVFYFA
jgi:hypothetical protein